VKRAALLALLVTLGVPAAASAGANDAASCNGIAVSSVAGEPGVVALLTRQFHDEAKNAGLPPGSFDASFAKIHAGSLEGCLGS
jgi:hypothetical protein